MAAQNGHLEMAKLLLNNKAPVESCGYYGSFPITRAATNGHRDVVEFLLEKGTQTIPCAQEDGCANFWEYVCLSLSVESWCGLCTRARGKSG